MKTCMLAIAAASLGLASAASAQVGAPLYSLGGDVTVEVLDSDSGYVSELWLTYPGSPQFIALDDDAGVLVDLGVFPDASEEMVFGIYVQDTGNWFYTGDAARNPDGIYHASITKIEDGVYDVGFEDILGGGDFDYNDNIFRFSGVIPTPGTAALGALGLMLVNRRKRA